MWSAQKSDPKTPPSWPPQEEENRFPVGIRGSAGGGRRAGPGRRGPAPQNGWTPSTIEQKPTGRTDSTWTELAAKPSFGPKASKTEADVSAGMGPEVEGDRERGPSQQGVPPPGAAESRGGGSLPGTEAPGASAARALLRTQGNVSSLIIVVPL